MSNGKGSSRRNEDKNKIRDNAKEINWGDITPKKDKNKGK